MYHYVQEFNREYPHFSYLNIKNFINQINFFKNNYNFFDCSDLSNFNYNSKNKIFLTFDDGLSCHYDYVFKALIEHELNAIFYIPALPYTHEKILDVHKIHLILGFLNGSKALNLLNKYITKDMINTDLTDGYEKYLYKLQLNSNDVSNFKKTLNYYIDYNYRSDIISKIFIECFGDIEKTIVKSFYLTIDQIQEMSDHNMIIGGHSVTHRLLSRLDKNEYENEINESFNFLNKFMKYKTFCYPYGGYHSFNSEIEKFLNNNNVEFSMNVESRDINENDFKNRKQALPRYDCNEFKYGQID